MSVLINMTYNGQSANYRANIRAGLDDASIRRICEEAVRAGEVPGIGRNMPVDAFRNFVVDRFRGNQGVSTVLRPKVPFG